MRLGRGFPCIFPNSSLAGVGLYIANVQVSPVTRSVGDWGLADNMSELVEASTSIFPTGYLAGVDLYIADVQVSLVTRSVGD